MIKRIKISNKRYFDLENIVNLNFSPVELNVEFIKHEQNKTPLFAS